MRTHKAASRIYDRSGECSEALCSAGLRWRERSGRAASGSCERAD